MTMTEEAPISPAGPSSGSVPRIVVPRTNESVLAIPELDGLPLVADHNARLLAASEVDLQGISFGQLRQRVRANVLEQASAYTSSIVGQAVEVPQAGPLIVTGHQPELFHAGVWAKNFATFGVANATSGLGLNLIIDNDTVDSTQIRIPAGTPAKPWIEWIPYDTGHPQQPWEESVVNDFECFTGFGVRVRSLMQDRWHYDPVISDFWPAAVRQASVSRGMSDCLTAVRIAAERSIGLRNLEVPMSRLCSDLPFCWFAAYLMAHLPRFHRIYNDAVREYRRAHKLRSTTHPVPELEVQDEWLEAPFWVWRSGDVRRDRPYLRVVGSEMELRDRSGWSTLLPISSERSLESGAAALFDIQQKGLRLRTRALTTTLFSRVFLADLFVHGIGGAKYDSMTDVICQKFFGIAAPQFATVSATLHLPLSTPQADVSGRKPALLQAIRDCKYNPDRQVSAFSNNSVAATLVEEKRQLLAKLVERRPTSSEHHQLERLNHAMGLLIEDRRQNLLSENEMLREQTAASAVFQDREFAWCLHPRSSIQSFLEQSFLPASR